MTVTAGGALSPAQDGARERSLAEYQRLLESSGFALERLDAWPQRCAAVAMPVTVGKKFVDNRADALGVQVAYWGFFSVFALLLAFVSILVRVRERSCVPEAGWSACP